MALSKADANALGNPYTRYIVDLNDNGQPDRSEADPWISYNELANREEGWALFG